MKGKVLLVDDDEVFTRVLADQMSARGYEVSVLLDPTDFKTRKSTFMPDIVLLDILMPQISGLKILEEIRKEHGPHELPVIMLTVKDAPAEISHALSLGANDYIVKPGHIEIADSRITTQLNFVRLTKDRARKSELEAIQSIVMTYNHEINNPLAVALGCLYLVKSGNTDINNIDRLERSLNRISEIVNMIRMISQSNENKLPEFFKGQKPVK